MSLSSKLSISDLDLAAKRTLIRVSVTAEKLLIFMRMDSKFLEICIAFILKAFWGAATFQEF
jgi:hypothetical protein